MPLSRRATRDIMFAGLLNRIDDRQMANYILCNHQPLSQSSDSPHRHKQTREYHQQPSMKIVEKTLIRRRNTEIPNIVSQLNAIASE